MAKLFFIIFQVIMPILLLNMLIAMMGNTYASVTEKSEKEFLKQVWKDTGLSTHDIICLWFIVPQWARVIMSMERSAPPDRAKIYLQEYSVRLGENLRGVMVIKSKDKTRASQRKGALANWKVGDPSASVTMMVDVKHFIPLENRQDHHQVLEEAQDDRGRPEEGNVGAR